MNQDYSSKSSHFQDGKKNVEVTGAAEDVKNAVAAIQEKIGGGRPPRKEQSKFNLTKCLNFTELKFFLGYGDDDGEKTTRSLMLPAGLIGRLVGKGGATIQEYSSEYNVRINIDKEAEEVVS